MFKTQDLDSHAASQNGGVRRKRLRVFHPSIFLTSAVLLVCLIFSDSARAIDPIVYTTGSVSVNAEGNDATQWVQADTFQLTDNYLITGGGVYVAGLGDFDLNWTGDLEYYFFDDAGTTPGTLLANAYATSITDTDTGVPWCCGGNIHLLEFDLVDPILLSADTPYWLGIHLGPDFLRRFVYWLHQGVPGDAMESEFGTFDNWTISQFKGAPRGFHLRGVVPEPTTTALLPATFLLLASRRRKHR